MGLLEEDDEGLGLKGQALDHTNLAGSTLKIVFTCIPEKSGSSAQIKGFLFSPSFSSFLVDFCFTSPSKLH